MTLVDDPVGEEETPQAREATPEFEAAAIRAESRRGFLIALPAYAYLVIFFALPLVIVFVYSFATRNSFGGTDLADWNLAEFAGGATVDLHPLTKSYFDTKANPEERDRLLGAYVDW